jgi:hypothetical protein
MSDLPHDDLCRFHAAGLNKRRRPLTGGDQLLAFAAGSARAIENEKKTMMKKLGLLSVFSLLLVLFGGSQALAVTNFNNAPQGAHYAKGASEPTCTLSGLTVTCTGTAIEGVGNTNATVNLSVTSTFTGTCTNPGGHLVEPFTQSETTTTTSVITSTKNGRLVVPAQTATAVSSEEFLANFTCPNPNWTPQVTGTAISFVYTLTFAGFTAPAITVTGP